MRRPSGLRRDTPKAREWASGTRTPLKTRGRRRTADKPSDGKVRAAVFARDGRCVLFSSLCRGGPTFHHRRKAGAGGAYVEANGTRLCEFHNGHIEDHPEMYVGDGPLAYLRLVVREGDSEWEQLGRRANR